jgi:hypothetical protein
LEICGGTCDICRGIYLDNFSLDVPCWLALFQNLRHRIRTGLYGIFLHGSGLYHFEHGAGAVQESELFAARPDQIWKEGHKGCCQALETSQVERVHVERSCRRFQRNFRMGYSAQYFLRVFQGSVISLQPTRE